MISYFLIYILFILSGSLLIHVIRKKLWLRKEFMRRQQIGKAGEEKTVRQLEKLRGYKKILKNLYVPLPDGTNTTEIDAVIIHEKGIFVVENKNYSGKIYGDEKARYWTQIQKEKGKKRKKWKKHFYSPLLQNQAHIRILKKHLDEKGDWEMPYVSVIVFNDSARLRRIRIHFENTLVINCRKSRKKLRKKIRWFPRALTRRQVDEIFKEMKDLENPGMRIKRNHEKLFL